MEGKTPNKQKKITIIVIVGALMLITMLYAFGKILHSIHYEETDNAQVETNAAPVINRVAGYVDTFNLQDYQEVKSGDLILSIDDSEYQIAVQQAQGDLQSAIADLQAAESQVSIINANRNVASDNVNVQEVKYQKSIADFKRDQSLYSAGAITKKQLEESTVNFETAKRMLHTNRSQVAQVTSQRGSSTAQIQKAKAVISIREANLAAAKLRLSYTKVYATTSGRIGKVNLRKGQFINAGQTLFSIVNSEKFWIIANFKETQIEHLEIGQIADIALDGYPSQKITGRITQLSDATGAKFTLLPPDNSSGNFVKVIQRVPVKIEFDDLKTVKRYLRAGLSVTVDVKLD